MGLLVASGGIFQTDPDSLGMKLVECDDIDEFIPGERCYGECCYCHGDVPCPGVCKVFQPLYDYSNSIAVDSLLPLLRYLS